MPAVVAFGRRWACGTDDFVFPGMLDTTVKSCWLISALVAYFRKNIEQFESKDQLEIYFLGMIASLVIIIITDVIAVHRSASGSIIDSDSRKYFVPLVYLRLFWEALDTVWNTLGTVWIFGYTFSTLNIDDPPTYFFVRRYIICNWVSLIVLALFFAFLYDPLGKIQDMADEKYFNDQSELWSKKLKKYCSILKRPNDYTLTRIQEIGKLIADILRDTTFVSSDVASGLFAMMTLEDQKRNLPVERAFKYTTNKDESDDLFPNDLAKEVEEVERYLPLLIPNNQWENITSKKSHSHFFSKFWRSVKSCSCDHGSSNTSNEHHDFCPYCNSSSLKESLLVLGVSEPDILHVSICNDYYEFPFCVFIHHSSKSIVLNIDGSFSVTKLIPYLDAYEVPLLNIPALESNSMVHGGMLYSAQLITQKMKALGLMEKLKKISNEYKLLIIGESFGAGVGSIVGLSLLAEFPELKVICVNPPGGIFSLDAAKLTENFVTSIIFGEYPFSYFNISSVRNLRQGIISVLYELNAPKFKLLLGILLRLIGIKTSMNISTISKSSSNVKSVGIFNKGHSITITPSQSLPQTSQNTGQGFANDTNKMYLPGTIIKINPERNSNDQKNFKLEIGDRNDFFEIKPSSQMFKDFNSLIQIQSAIKEYIQNFKSKDNTQIE